MRHVNILLTRIHYHLNREQKTYEKYTLCMYLTYTLLRTYGNKNELRIRIATKNKFSTEVKKNN